MTPLGGSGDRVWNRVWARVRDRVWDRVGDRVRDRVRDRVGDRVRDRVWARVRDRVWDRVESLPAPDLPIETTPGAISAETGSVTVDPQTDDDIPY